MHSRTLNALTERKHAWTQEENAQLTYGVNWAGLLDSDTVSTSTWTTEDSNLSIDTEASTTKLTTAQLSGDSGRYRAVNKIVTAAGDTHERYIEVTILDNSLGYGVTNDYGWFR